MKAIAIGCVAVLLLVGSTLAFDGQRKGFVLGGGLGIALDSKYEADLIVVKPEENGAGAALAARTNWACRAMRKEKE